LVEMIQVSKPIEEVTEFMETLVECMQEFKTRGEGQFSQSEGVEGLYLLDTIVSGLSMAALVEMGAMHNFAGE